ncbi:hypothetical protein CC1G_04896 [Coprinopsis cinerea okayama7|uniref:DUF6593 domain-containing protein n=1 Tax=Coprinopsis cinerea (strain Okayama-7 / 130 / ATCC MYA-4618 / FGSC 9003) TaxID=240176 RepID=A8PFF3_COPC7|nr:hypothetical protein CC1G_04896 [Coprinopsis cinerea okayama7\|eukprot:XP_001841052.2 hypothetical protein CC1G_04896 [Coprinopsis cinerea okayama7\
MFGSNPYAAGGWYNPQNPLSINGGGHPWFPNSNLPPTFGALPTANYSSSRLAFEFAPAQPDILNCTVDGPNRNTYFRVATANGATVIMKPRNEGMARIEWGTEPSVEIRNIIPRANASHWLRLSQDQSHRTMVVNGRNYVWIPRGGAILLLSAGPTPPAELGRITRSSGKVTLELVSDAIQAGLLEASVVATVLFQSGRNMG